MEFFSSEPFLAALIGACGGLFLGLAARLGRFCTLGAIEDALYGGSTLRMRMWVIAIGAAIIASFSAIGLGYVEAEKSAYLSQAFSPMASIIGGLMFGYGMALAGNCGFGAIARLGGGDLRSFVIVLVMGVSTYIALSGPLAELRIWAFPQMTAAQPAGIAHALGALSGLPIPFIGIAIGLTILGFGLWAKDMRPAPAIWGCVVGLAVASAWVGTSWLNTTGFDGLPVVSHTFSAPIGDTMLFAMLSSGLTISFGVGSVVGVWVGAFVGSLIKGHFRWEACDDPRELRRQILGAGIMGIGAVIAMGCTIGQGVSAFSLLSYSAPITMVSIFAGAAFGLRQLIEGFHAAPE